MHVCVVQGHPYLWGDGRAGGAKLKDPLSRTNGVEGKRLGAVNWRST